MKKIALLLVLLVLITGCQRKEEIEEKHITSIISPSGAPALSLFSLFEDENYDIEIVDGSEPLQAEFTQGKKDIIIAPINLGVKLSENTGNYKLLSIITTSNLYFLSNKDNIESIAAFGEMAVPGKIINFIKEYLPTNNIEFFESNQEATQAYLTGKYDAVIIAYPLINKITSIQNDCHITNLIDFYQDKSGLDNYPQAALFVSNDFYLNNNEIITKLLNELMDTNNTFINDKELFKKSIDNKDLSYYGFASNNLIEDSYKELSINIIPAYKYINECKAFLKLFNIELNDSLIINIDEKE